MERENGIVSAKKEVFWATQHLARMGLLVALSAVGALVKIPSTTGTVAFDSAPGYLAAYLFGWKEGAIVAAFGHLFSAATAGFPLGLPMHLYIAAQMAVYAAVFGCLARLGKGGIGILIAAVLVVSVLNGVLAPASIIPFYGIGAFMGMVVSLLVASFANVLLAAVVGRILHPVLKRQGRG